MNEILHEQTVCQKMEGGSLRRRQEGLAALAPPVESKTDGFKMNQYRLVQPSPVLKARVMSAAQEVWAKTEPAKPSITFRNPAILRFVASIAATIVVVCGANSLDRLSLARWQQPAPAQPTPAQQLAKMDPIFRDNPALARMAMMAAAHVEKPSDEQILRYRGQMRALLRTLDAEHADGQENMIGFPQTRSQRGSEEKILATDYADCADFLLVVWDCASSKKSQSAPIRVIRS